ncbi:MAG: hypothetical protein PHD87_01690 [Candidatus Cloacimonetes bacterium]|nr:hypothetical protein [Candidatus Cloacimonadota bacterium]
MKKLNYIILVLALLLGFAACSENDPPTGEDVLGYKLDQFIDAATVRAAVDPEAEEDEDFRSLFAYEIVSGVDGYSPRDSENAGYDLPWEIFADGYFVPSDDHRTWFPNASLPGAFKVRDAGLFRLYRKVEVSLGLGGSKLVEIGALATHQLENWDGANEDAIKLSDLTQGIAAYDSLTMFAADGYSKTYPPDLMEDGYYLLGSEVSTFPTYNDTLPSSVKKFKKLARIEVYGCATAQNHDFALTPNDEADLVINVPADLSGFTSTVMTTR